MKNENPNHGNPPTLGYSQVVKVKYIETKTKPKTDENMQLYQPIIVVNFEDHRKTRICRAELNNTELFDFFPNQINLFFVCKGVIWETPMKLIVENDSPKNPWHPEYIKIVLDNFTYFHCDLTSFDNNEENTYSTDEKKCKIKDLLL